MSETLRIGLAGLGTVGVGVLKILNAHDDLLTKRCGRPLQVTAVCARDKSRNRDVDITGYGWFDDPVALATSDKVDVVIEVIGGADGPAKAAVEAGLKAGKHVVTANKALIAHHGTSLAALAEENGVALAYEAAVAGGIPIIKALREGLAANRIHRLYGILNGTCNYILTRMETTGEDFSTVLDAAQKLGYAEADPSFDVGGVDAAHKLAILAAVAFGMPVDFDSVFIEGIENVSADDIAYAHELGYRIKLLGLARLTADGVEQRVHPCMVPIDTPIAAVDDVFNAVVTEGDFAGQSMLDGRGAGEGPTASAVLADVMDIARGLILPAFGVPSSALVDQPKVDISAHQGVHYLRFSVLDEPGVVAGITTILAEHNISIDSMIQRARAPGSSVPVVIITHECREVDLQSALAQISALDISLAPPHLIRIVRP